MKVIVTVQAFERLAEIEMYIAEDDPKAAERLIDTLLRRAEVLADFPKMGRMVPELADEATRELIEGNYRLVFPHEDVP
jgi:plasmid stabilization system protein ParE